MRGKETRTRRSVGWPPCSKRGTKHEHTHQCGVFMLGICGPAGGGNCHVIIKKLPYLDYFFVETTILSMLFSHARGGGVNWVLKKFADPVPLSTFRVLISPPRNPVGLRWTPADCSPAQSTS